ncbi:MAG TPA: hypothetical protein VHD62_09960 [Opitutaceae bacterium]|nr:hypothetical protein [Opitutaceae bacterium]
MDGTEKPLVYLILGAVDSGRREVLVDLAEAGLAEADRAAVLVADDEPADDADARLPGLTRWTWADGAIAGAWPGEATHVFFVTSGWRNPVDQIEAFKAWLEAQGGELARVLCVVNCRLAEKNPSLLAWFEACVHFADVVLLNRRDGVDNKWLGHFQAHFKKQFYPCVFEFVKDGRVKNPALVLEPQALRMTHVFDEEQDLVFTDSTGEEIDEQEDSDEEEIEATPEEDPYFARRNGGRRVREIPDIAQFL